VLNVSTAARAALFSSNLCSSQPHHPHRRGRRRQSSGTVTRTTPRFSRDYPPRSPHTTSASKICSMPLHAGRHARRHSLRHHHRPLQSISMDLSAECAGAAQVASKASSWNSAPPPSPPDRARFIFVSIKAQIYNALSTASNLRVMPRPAPHKAISSREWNYELVRLHPAVPDDLWQEGSGSRQDSAAWIARSQNRSSLRAAH